MKTNLTTFKIALDALMRNRARSLLTMLGVIIGVAAVIVTVAIGAGARVSVQNQIDSLGSNMIVVMPGSVTSGGARSGYGGASTLTPDDGLAIAKLAGVAAVSPMVTTRSQVVAGDNNWQTTISGVAPTYTFIRSWPMASGTFFGENDTLSANKVAVLGQTVVQSLFPDGSSPLGKTVLIKGVPFTVVGTLSPLGQSGMGQDQDDTILVPYSAAMQRLTGQTTVSTLMVSASDAQQVANVQTEVTQLLEQRHDIVPPAQDDFNVRNLQSIAAAASSTGAVMEFLLAGVAAVSLIVGGIGIMNIMLVSVTERTREIGLRMAVGARARVILRQFLTESVVLSTAGGLIGVMCGLLGTQAVALMAKWPMVIPAVWVAFAVAFSALVGVFFGYYPARKASQLKPIEALRFE
jgi:putative ABC transport system permease protein